MQEEHVILVNEQDEPIGLCPKMEAHEKALLHRAFSVFIFNDKGELLLQQRAGHKYHSPNLWTNTVCSHQRQGESNLEAGKRRLQEEMGMQTNLKEVFHFIYKAEFDNGLTEHELDHVLIGFSNDNPLINPDEVKDYRWESLENIQKDIEQSPEKYTEWFKIIFKNSLQHLQTELEQYFLNRPMIFNPVFKEKPWGGVKLKTILNKNIPSKKTGESWEISSVSGDVSVISTGYFKGKNLVELIEKYPQEILGKKVYKKYPKDFPLLIKYIDAEDDLSIQVHPDDEIARKLHNSFGKNELWHIIQADAGAVLYIGFKENTDRDIYLQHLQTGDVEKILNKIPVTAGDTFYIPAGTVHAIGKGVLLAEIQQTSDITYRIYDWNRTGLDGKPRELHTELALQSIHFEARPQAENENFIETPYFKIRKQNFSNAQTRDISGIESFIILMNTGNGIYKIDNVSFKRGDVLLLPAIKREYQIEVLKTGEFLEIYL